MGVWESYYSRLSQRGATRREMALNREREYLSNKLSANLSFHTASIDGVDREVAIIDSKDLNQKSILSLSNDRFIRGSLVVWGTSHWLIIEVDANNEVYNKATMVRCNRQLRWQNQYTGDLVERWCLVSKPYTSNINEGVVIATSNRQFKIQIPYDNETIQIDLDRRFLLEKIDNKAKAYEVVSVDAQTGRYQDTDGGFLIWNLEQCEFNPATDNPDLMIADYFAPKSEQASIAGLLPCRINGRDTIRCGTKRKYNIVFYDADGDITTEPNARWSWSPQVCTEGIEFVVNNNTLEISLYDEALPVGSVIEISAADTDGHYSPTTLQVEVIDLL